MSPRELWSRSVLNQDPPEGGEFDGVDVAPWSLSVDQFVLVKTVHGLGEGVIVGLSGQSEIGSPGGPG